MLRRLQPDGKELDELCRAIDPALHSATGDVIAALTDYESGNYNNTRPVITVGVTTP